MSQLDGSREALLHAGQDARQRVTRAWNDFTDFALRDNVLEVAVGLILAAAFTAVVNSFVSDIILPPISLLPFISRNFDQKFAVLRNGVYARKDHHYNTLKQALDDGAVVLAYGSFIDKIIRLLGIAMALYAVARIYGWTTHDNIIKHTVRCKYCRKYIGEKAQRCVNCTSWQDGREERRLL